MASTAKEALQANNELATNATAAITELGINDDDLKTSSVSLTPVTTFNNDRTSTITGFRASNTLSVTIRPYHDGDRDNGSGSGSGAADLDSLVGDVLTVLVNEGINTINYVTFQADNITEAANTARALADDDAFTVASVFAQAACYEIIGVADMIVNDDNIPQPNSDDFVAFGGAAPSVSTPISSGDITLSSSVDVDYIIQRTSPCSVAYGG